MAWLGALLKGRKFQRKNPKDNIDTDTEGDCNYAYTVREIVTVSTRSILAA
jgi:hypothetical protein